MFFCTSSLEKLNEFLLLWPLQEIKDDCSSESTAAAEFQLTLVLSNSIKKIYL